MRSRRTRSAFTPSLSLLEARIAPSSFPPPPVVTMADLGDVPSLNDIYTYSTEVSPDDALALTGPTTCI